LVLSPIGREKSPGASIGRRLGESASFGQKLKLINNRLIIRLWSSKSNASKTNIKRQLLQRTQRVLIFQFFIKIFRELNEEKSPGQKEAQKFSISRGREKKINAYRTYADRFPIFYILYARNERIAL